ncbi:unnamed protein product [Rotaria sp. Silwood2]|nr:unnamed protein product [Rotaria sp. Silwood2]CAF2940025.1 unnamed protein product [Rotaria sp. Silwood2]
MECSYSTFTRHIPSYIISPKPSDWGTCLCMTCLNPQLKSERINQLKNVNPLLNYLSSLLTNDLTSIINDEKTVNEILEELHRLKKLQNHMEYVHAQFKGAKFFRQSALTNNNVVTLQIDWSENYHLKQVREERCEFL